MLGVALVDQTTESVLAVVVVEEMAQIQQQGKQALMALPIQVVVAGVVVMQRLGLGLSQIWGWENGGSGILIIRYSI